jgi:hypothetical protein
MNKDYIYNTQKENLGDISRRQIIDFPLRRPGFNPKTVRVGHSGIGEETSQGTLISLGQFYHYSTLSSGPGTTGSLAA